MSPYVCRMFVLLLSLLLFGNAVADFNSVDAQSDSMIYDIETDQYFPITEFSKTEDPKIILPGPDPTEFPPDYLKSLLQHCDDPIPGVLEFVTKVWIAFQEFGLNWSRYPGSIPFAWRLIRAIRPMQIVHTLVAAVVLSVSRYCLQKLLLPSLVTKHGLTTRSASRLLESSWKSLCFLVMWLFSFQAVILSGRTDFAYPLRLFKDVRIQVGYFDIPTPSDFYRIYTMQLGFYLHSLWSLFFLDTWRKDSHVLAVHHVMTLLLLEVSLVLRFHRIGLLVLFLHDLNDVFLELAKVNVYLRVRHGQSHDIHTTLSNICFTIFTISWVVMRLYWYPLKVLYATTWGVYIGLLGRDGRSFLFINGMLWTLFIMHIYWFRFISIMAFRLITQSPSDDIREVESSDEESCPPQQCNGISPVVNGKSGPAAYALRSSSRNGPCANGTLQTKQ